MAHALLADDNALFRNFVRDILVRHFPGLSVAEAGSSDKAVALDAELHPQLVFLDIKLPDRNGLDFVRQWRIRNPEARIYLVTQLDLPEYRAAASECGADRLLVMGESSEAAIVSLVESMLAGKSCLYVLPGTGEQADCPEEAVYEMSG